MGYNGTIQRLTRAQRHGSHGSAAKDMLRLLALVGMGASAIYWWNVQSTLTENRAIAIAFTAILVLAPPTLVSFLIPWSPGGMLLQKVNARTWGYVTVIGCSLFLVYYSFQIQWSWWQAQPVVAESGLVYQQALIGIIGFIIIPALLWAPVSDDELKENLKQAQLVKRYELQAQADIAVLQATMLRAQQQAAVGLANLTAGERAELAATMRGIIGGIDRTIQEMAGNLNNAATVVYGGAAKGAFGAPAFSDDLATLMEYVATALEDSRMEERALDLRLAGARFVSEIESHEAERYEASGGDRNVTAQPTRTLAAPQGDKGQRAERYEALQSDRNVRPNVPEANVAEPLGASERPGEPTGDLAAVQATFARGAFRAADLHLAFPGMAESTAGKLIAEWAAAGHIEQCKTRGYYRLTQEGGR